MNELQLIKDRQIKADALKRAQILVVKRPKSSLKKKR
jgi:hypothetical protein